MKILCKSSKPGNLICFALFFFFFLFNSGWFRITSTWARKRLVLRQRLSPLVELWSWCVQDQWKRWNTAGQMSRIGRWATHPGDCCLWRVLEHFCVLSMYIPHYFMVFRARGGLPYERGGDARRLTWGCKFRIFVSIRAFWEKRIRF